MRRGERFAVEARVQARRSNRVDNAEATHAKMHARLDGELSLRFCNRHARGHWTFGTCEQC